MMDLLQHWIERKAAQGYWHLHEPSVASHTFHVHTGPRYIFGQVTLAASPAKEFSFTSVAEWPENCNCDTFVLDGILDVIIAYNFRPVLGVAFTLQAISWHPIDAVPMGYYLAAKEATKKILRLEDKQHNVELSWPVTT